MANQPNEITLEVNGQRYGGWESGSVTLDLEAVCGSFELAVSERWANRSTNWPINVQDACKIKIGGQTLISGIVERRKPFFHDGAAGFTLNGRDKARNLVDCSAFLGAWEFNNFDVYKLAQKICGQVGLKAALQPQLIGKHPIVRVLNVGVGETLFNALENACRQAGVLMVNDGDGEITLSRPDDTPPTASLVEGQNLKDAESDVDVSGRFYKYRVVSQQVGYEELSGAGVAHVWGEATDPAILDQSRVLIIHAEVSATPAYAKLRAQWEAAVRAARSQTVNCTVQGWTRPDGDLWSVNTLVQFDSPRLRTKGNMLVTRVRFAMGGGQGTTTAITLRRPDAFAPAPLVPPDRWNELRGGV
jgi:prophage tail gpP-like protein